MSSLWIVSDLKYNKIKIIIFFECLALQPPLAKKDYRIPTKLLKIPSFPCYNLTIIYF